MSFEKYREALELLRTSGLKLLVSFPQPPEVIAEVERQLGHPLPASYKLMLSEHGMLIFPGRDFYGIGRRGLEGTSLQTVLANAKHFRAEGTLSDKMVTILQSGYGPYFVLDCGEMDKDEEAPVYELTLEGVRGDKKKVADSFGAFLLDEVKMVVNNAGQATVRSE